MIELNFLDYQKKKIKNKTMQVFCPFKEPIKIAEALWRDKKRFNKQIIECKQILNAIDGTGKGWFNHPVVKMYKSFWGKQWLKYYLDCLESYKDYVKFKETFGFESSLMKENCEYYNNLANTIVKSELFNPFSEEFCDQHKRRLYTKSPELYPQFAKYGISEVNYYYVDGKLLKYIKGKRI